MTDVHDHLDDESTDDEQHDQEDAGDKDSAHLVTIWIGGVRRELRGNRRKD